MTLEVDEQSVEACIEARMAEHEESREEAEKYCREAHYAVEEPKHLESDNLGIVGREATPMERCISCRIDIYGEDEAEALRECTKMFNDPLVKHTFEAGTPEQMGVAFHNWEKQHDAKWAWWRQDQATKKAQKEKAVDEIIKEIQRNPNDPEHTLAAISLRERAEQIYEIRKGKSEAEKKREEQTSRLTVGSTFGKTRKQIIAEDTDDQPFYDKTKAQIIEETYEPSGDERLTVGNLFKAKDAHRVEQTQVLAKTPLESCIDERMKDGMTRAEAKAWCRKHGFKE